MRTRRAIVAGGSIGGLFAARMLALTGWEVTVLERSAEALAGRGAGIVTHAELVAILEACGADISDLGVAVRERVAFDKAGCRIREIEFPQVVTSWDRIFSMLRRLMPDHAYRNGAAVTGYAQDGDGVSVLLGDGTNERADLLVGADGFRSAVRAQMHPAVEPVFSGYVVWRALVAEADIPDEIRRDVFGAFGFFLPYGNQVIGYPIVGPGNDLRPGHRRYNIVWYRPVQADELDDMLTGSDGIRHAVSIPPPLIREEVLERMHAAAGRDLARPFVAMLKRGDRPFFTPIYDHFSPSMADGRVALSGDAACVARPHVGMGVTKAASDAASLAKHLSVPGCSVAEALAGYSAERVAANRHAFERSRELGAFVRPPEGKRNRDGRGNPDIDTIMIRTAAIVAG